MTTAPDAFNRRFLAYFAVFLVVCAMAYIVAITFLQMPSENIRFADTVLGAILGSMIATPLGYFYGSSKSTGTKDDAIISMLPKDGAAAPHAPATGPEGETIRELLPKDGKIRDMLAVTPEEPKP